MKKFSNISGYKVNEEPQIQKSRDQIEKDALKATIMKLMDNYLQIRSYGSARTELLNGSLKISGQELFTEALLDLLSDKSFFDQIKALESLKLYNKDWESIDDRIGQIQTKIEESKSIDRIQVKKIKSLLDIYGNDLTFDVILDKYVSRVKNGEEAYMRAKTAQKMMLDDRWSNYSKYQLQQIS